MSTFYAVEFKSSTEQDWVRTKGFILIESARFLTEKFHNTGWIARIVEIQTFEHYRA